MDILYCVAFYLCIFRSSHILAIKTSCPSGWKIFNDKCYFTSREEASFSRARLYCRGKARGAQLAGLESKEENDFIRRNITGDKFQYWVGLTTNVSWVWPDNTKSDPDRVRVPRDGERDYCAVVSYANGNILFRNCSSTDVSFICQKAAQNAVCLHNWEYFAESCYLLLNGPGTFTEATHTCWAHNAHLVTLGEEIVAEFIFNKIKSLNNRYYWVNLKKRWTLRWDSGNAYLWNKWERVPVAGESMCAVVSGQNGLWNMVDCDGSNKYICQIDAVIEPVVEITNNVNFTINSQTQLKKDDDVPAWIIILIILIAIVLVIIAVIAVVYSRRYRRKPSPQNPNASTIPRSETLESAQRALPAVPIEYYATYQTVREYRQEQICRDSSLDGSSDTQCVNRIKNISDTAQSCDSPQGGSDTDGVTGIGNTPDTALSTKPISDTCTTKNCLVEVTAEYVPLHYENEGYQLMDRASLLASVTGRFNVEYDLPSNQAVKDEKQLIRSTKRRHSESDICSDYVNLYKSNDDTFGQNQRKGSDLDLYVSPQRAQTVPVKKCGPAHALPLSPNYYCDMTKTRNDTIRLRPDIKKNGKDVAPPN